MYYKRKIYINKKQEGMIVCLWLKMNPPHFSLRKERLLTDISQHFDGEVSLLFEIDCEQRNIVRKELKEYGQLFFDEHPPWSPYIGVKISDTRKAANLVDRLYSSGVRGILDVGVDSRTVSLAGYERLR